MTALDVVYHRVEAGCIAHAERSLIAKVHVGPLRPGRLPSERGLAADAVGLIHRRHSSSSRVIPAGIWTWPRE